MGYDRTDDVEGSRWRVVKAGARLFGWTPIVGGHQGGGRRLNPGDALTCTGSARTMGDGGPALMWAGPQGEPLAADRTFTPVKEGTWGGQVPEDGFVEPAQPAQGARAPIPQTKRKEGRTP